MSIPSSSVPIVTLPLKTIKELKENNLELQTINELERQKNLVHEQTIKILKNENTELERDLNGEKIEKQTLIQLIEDDLQSSKRVLQCVCAIAGAILGGSAVLVFPPAGAAIALVGTGSAATGVAVAGVAVAGGAAGGCLVAPVIHKKMNNALVQQVQNFKAKDRDL